MVTPYSDFIAATKWYCLIPLILSVYIFAPLFFHPVVPCVWVCVLNLLANDWCVGSRMMIGLLRTVPKCTIYCPLKSRKYSTEMNKTVPLRQASLWQFYFSLISMTDWLCLQVLGLMICSYFSCWMIDVPSPQFYHLPGVFLL